MAQQNETNNRHGGFETEFNHRPGTFAVEEIFHVLDQGISYDSNGNWLSWKIMEKVVKKNICTLSSFIYWVPESSQLQTQAVTEDIQSMDPFWHSNLSAVSSQAVATGSQVQQVSDLQIPITDQFIMRKHASKDPDAARKKTITVPKDANKCQYCGLEFRQRYRLKRHLDVHIGKEPDLRRCWVCKAPFKFRATLLKHINKAHRSPA